MKKITTLLFITMALFGVNLSLWAVNTECAGTSTEAASGFSFETGYNYAFTTSGTDVTFTCELLDNKVGVAAYAWTYNSGFAETAMTNVSGKIFSKTFSGQTVGASFNVACKFAYAGGMTVTKTYTYTVGNTCTASLDTEAPTNFTATKGTEAATSVDLILNATDNSGAVIYSITYGATTINTGSPSGVQKTYTVTGLAPSTAYSFAVTAKDAAGNTAANSPVTINATTTALPVPAASAATPPSYTATKVISIFSDAYTTVGNMNYNPNWGQSTVVSQMQIGADNLLKYANLNYQGTTFDHVYPVTMKYLHLDVWTANETSLMVYPICWNGSGNETEKFKTLSSITLNQWNSFDIPLTDFTSQGLTMQDVYQLKIVGTGGKTVYLDNIYFYDNTANSDTEAPTSFTATKGTVTADEVELLLNATDNSGAVTYTISYGSGPTVLTTTGLSGVQKSFKVSGLTGSTAYSFSITAKDASDNAAANSPIVINATTLAAIPAAPTPIVDALKVKSVYSDTYTNLPNVIQNWWGNTFSTVTLSGNTTLKNVSLCCFGYEFTGGTINVTDMTKLHVDIYPETLASMTLGVTGGGEFKKSGIALTANQWNSVNVSLSELTGANLTSIAQVGFWDLNGTFYLDNLYFYNDTPTGLTSVENNIKIYPNPVKDQLKISAKSEISSVVIRNLMGQSVVTSNASGIEQLIDLSTLKSGNYIVTIELENGTKSTSKLAKL